MTGWLAGIIVFLKATHIAALSVWCGGLLAVPLMLSRHDPAVTPEDYRRIRRATHLTYTICATPAAVIAVVTGTWLIFFREVFVPWLYAKLVFVALLVAAHAWIGHLLVQMAERPDQHRPARPYLPVTAVLLSASVILVLVLAKPDLGWIAFPDWLEHPRGGQLLFDVPNR